MALTQHCSHVHRAELDAQMEEADNRKQNKWSNLQIYDMIMEKSRYTGQNILVHLATRFNVDRELIRALQRSVRYRREKRRILAELEEAALPFSPPPPPPPPPPPRSPSSDPEVLISEPADEDLHDSDAPGDTSSAQPAAPSRAAPSGSANLHTHEIWTIPVKCPCARPKMSKNLRKIGVFRI